MQRRLKLEFVYYVSVHDTFFSASQLSLQLFPYHIFLYILVCISEGNCGLEFQGSSTLKLNFKGQSRSRVPKTFQGFFKGTLENPQNFKGVSRVPLKTLQFQGKVEGENFKGGKSRGKG